MAEYVQSEIKVVRPEDIVLFEGPEENVLKNAATIVLNKLKECELFCGKYDARNGNEHYMYGISTVMEVIANYAGDEGFEDMFLENMTKSEEKAKPQSNLIGNDKLNKRRSTWTDEEIKILEDGCKNHEPINAIAEKLSNRTETAIQVKINKLGLHKKYPNPRIWTEEETEILKNGYKNGESAKQIAEKLPGRNADSVRAKAISMKLIIPNRHTEKWNEEEIKMLEKFFLSSDIMYNDEIYSKLSNHTKSSIKSKASELGLTKQRKENIDNNLVGKRYGRWTILHDVGVVNGYRMVHCACDCGTERDVDLSNLKAGISKSCGCYHNEVAAQNGKNNKKENDYDIETYEYGVGWTENDYVFYFDKQDFDVIKQYCWHKHQDGYLRTRYDYYYDENGKIHNKYIMMHQLLSNIYFNGKLLDHINGHTYDNRKCNLRPAIHLDNSKNVKLPISNKSGHKGVIQTPNGNWMAYITSDEIRYNLGTYSNYEDAVKVRERAEDKYFKEFNREKEYL